MTKLTVDKKVKPFCYITMVNKMTDEIIAVIKSIPKGMVASYGQIARLAGYANGARQVVRILHTCSEKYDLPWYRVVNIKGEIALSIYSGADEQRARLEAEGVTFISEYKVNLEKHLWDGK
jgi:methylated-DNA-protein-cysteine methyltransferase-like protein